MSVSKRRQQAVNRREWVSDLRRRWDYRTGRIPHDATSVSACSCGARSWVTGESSADDRQWFDDFDAMHADCGAAS